MDSWGLHKNRSAATVGTQRAMLCGRLKGSDGGKLKDIKKKPRPSEDDTAAECCPRSLQGETGRESANELWWPLEWSGPALRDAADTEQQWNKGPVDEQLACMPYQRIGLSSIKDINFNLLGTAVTICTTSLNIKWLFALPTLCIWVFRMILTVNSDSFRKRH
jgi:hypothetical protein